MTQAEAVAGGASRPSAVAAPKAPGPFSAFEWWVAFRYLRARRANRSVSVIAAFSFIGIALGVWALIVIMAVMNGFHHDLREKMIGFNGHMFLQGVETPLTDYAAVAERVGKVPGVTLALPLIEGQAFVSSPFGSSGAFVRGVLEADLKRLPGVGNHITQGTIDGFDKGPGVAVGAKLAERLSLRIGDAITVISPHGAETPFGVAPRMKSYPVTAIFQVGMTIYDAGYIFMPFAESQAYFDLDGQANLIEVYVDNPDDMDAMRGKIEAAEQRPMIATDWREFNKGFFDVLAIESNVMFSILMLIVLVAALNIISGLIMLVQDKARAIAVMRTMGATRGAIMRIFFITGSTIGVVGTLVGLVVGLLTANHVESIRQALNHAFGLNIFPADFYYLSALPSRVEARDVALVVALSLLLSFAATLYPSWRAAKLDPVEALRYE